MLGLTAVGCEIIGGEVPTAEYGSPYADFEVKGKVFSSDLQQPIYGIKVTVKSIYGFEDMTVTTDQEGRFELLGTFFPSSSLTLEATDTDGDENGGRFAPSVITVPLEKVPDTGDGWYEGEYHAEDVQIQMSRDISSGW